LKGSQELIQKSVDDTHQLVLEMKDYMHRRAEINDRRQATIIQQTNKAAAAATTAVQKTETIEQTAKDAKANALEAAVTSKAVDEKLKSAVHPPLPAQPWAGNRR
jgi:hypothetical protein